ncbi:GNAT family N-acetyltransferase [Nocardia crassostreae]|uniref:GNAT family N-acetyltransferase n=1 Tax=Nocardia crassostreae TaxID=53428 RepID=UPI001C3FF1B2|nr:GNAT family N-acetyltransferase [Nocardia crassostreae]
MFCSTELAARPEGAETELIIAGSAAAAARRPDGGGFTIPIAGGVAAYAEEGAPLDKVAGLGFAGVPDPAELDDIEARFAERKTPVQIELAHLADPALAALLTARGYRLLNFENVLGRALLDDPEPVHPEGVEIRPSEEGEFDLWIDIAAEGFAHPDTQGVASHEEFPRDILANAMRDITAATGIQRFLAYRNAEVAGCASMRISRGVAQLTGATTRPAHRRHGIQSALLATRLVLAKAAGCDIAVITTQPGSKSQQNAQRSGFDLLYTRAILVKD